MRGMAPKLKPRVSINHTGGSIPVFRGARMQRGYGLGGMLKGLFKSAMPIFKQGGKLIGKRALQSGINIAQNVMKGNRLGDASTAELKRITNQIKPPIRSKKKKVSTTHKRKSGGRPTIISNKTKRRKRSPDIFDKL